MFVFASTSSNIARVAQGQTRFLPDEVVVSLLIILGIVAVIALLLQK